METRPILFVLALLAAAGAFAEAYTWTDEDGVVHYSDRPQPGAKVIQLEESAPARPSPTSRALSTNPDGSDEATSPTTGYQSFTITSPAAEETLWNIGATLNVQMVLSPALKRGHQIRVYFDGTPRMVTSTSFTIDEVYRGVHRLQAEVIDQSGRLIIRSDPNRFYVQQNSIL